VPTPSTLTKPIPPSTDFTCLRLQLQQVGPHVPSRLSVISNLSIGMKTKHFGCVGQWEGLNGFCNQNGNTLSHHPQFLRAHRLNIPR